MAYSSSQIIAKIIEENVPDLRLKNAVFLDYLSAKGCVVKGDHTDLYWDAIASGSSTGTVPMSTAGTDQTTGDAVQASLGVGAYKVYHQFTVGLLDLQNASAAGVGKLKNLFRQNVKGGMIQIRRQLNSYLWNADGTAANGGIVGLAKVLDPTYAYAGIDPVAYPQWTPILAAAAAPRNLTRQILYDFSRILEEQEAYHEALFCTPTMAQTYNNLFDNVAGINAIQLAQKEDMVDLGYSMRAYNGAPLLTDPMMPNGQIVGINHNDIELITMNLTNADQGEISSMGLMNNISSLASADVGGLQVNVALLPQSNPGQVTFQMFVLPQLKVTNRRSVQAITKLN